MTALGFDSSVLNPFARAKRLDVLDELTAGHRRVTTRAVLEEIDGGAVSAAKATAIVVRRSLGLVCNGLHRKSLDIAQATGLVDELISNGGARFPCDGAGFEAWAESNGLLATG